jgi:uncharacterized membrane protein YidH (DUF202 family)
MAAGSVQLGRTPAILRWSLISGFLAYTMNFVCNYVLQSRWCSPRLNPTLHMISVFWIVVAFSGCLAGLQTLRRLPAERDEEGGKPHDRGHFQVLLAIGLSVALAVATIATAIPAWMVEPCR